MNFTPEPGARLFIWAELRHHGRNQFVRNLTYFSSSATIAQFLMMVYGILVARALRDAPTHEALRPEQDFGDARGVLPVDHLPRDRCMLRPFIGPEVAMRAGCPLARCCRY